MANHKDKKVMIFVDGSNLFWACKRYGKRENEEFRINIDKFIDHHVKGRDYIRTYWYVSTKTPPLVKQEGFYKHLEHNGVVVKKKPLVEGKEKGIDVWLVVDLLCFGFRGAYDVAVVYSEDRDMCSAYDEVRNLGLRIEVTALNGDYNPEILRHCDVFTPFDDYAKYVKK
ncbi:MAG TPA: hypothetical protein DCP02_02445 [Actinobacteria bacterium]|nr:hypothetical protein [Actinomycetota bacterium]